MSIIIRFQPVFQTVSLRMAWSCFVAESTSISITVPLDMTETFTLKTADCFYQFNVPVWYCWSTEVANQPNFAHLAPLPYQLQEGTTIITKFPHPLTPTPLLPSSVISSLPLATSSSQPKSVIWVEFLTHCQKHYEECIQKETPQQKQVWLACLANPPRVNTKVFGWAVNDNGNFIWQAIPKKMHEDVLVDYPPSQVYYGPIKNEYDCCEEYKSSAPGEAPNDYNNDNTISWMLMMWV